MTSQIDKTDGIQGFNLEPDLGKNVARHLRMIAWIRKFKHSNLKEFLIRIPISPIEPVLNAYVSIRTRVCVGK